MSLSWAKNTLYLGGVINGASPIWGIKGGYRIFYFMWTVERMKDATDEYVRLITGAHCGSFFLSRPKIKQENHLGLRNDVLKKWRSIVYSNLGEY